MTSLYVITNTPPEKMLIQNIANDPSQPDGPLQGGRFRHNNTTAPSEKKVVPLFTNKNKTAIVTGAGAGIGLAVAQGLAESGANVAIWYHSNRKALDRAQEIEEEYGVQCEKIASFAHVSMLMSLRVEAEHTKPMSRTTNKSKQPSIKSLKISMAA
jgi:hypothetical protein